MTEQEESVNEEVKKDRDVEENKAVGALAYILFFLPLIAAKDSKFAMYHANQGLLLLLLAFAVNIVGSIIPILGWFLILPFGNILVFVLFLMGMIRAAQGHQKPLPMIGNISILK